MHNNNFLEKNKQGKESHPQTEVIQLADPNEPQGSDQQEVRQPSRRKFLVNAGYAIGGAIVGGALVGSLTRRNPNTAAPPPPGASPGNGGKAPEPRNYNRALMFFNQEQFAIADAATERIFPQDENGPGARGLGVAYFLDHQLAGEWGFNGREYMSPPFFHGEIVQGYQGRLRRREMFAIGLREIDNHSQAKFNKSFVELNADQQDQVLEDFEKDQVKLTTISPSGFFKILRTGTLEGSYSDPLYGGNLDMNGWKMRNYPGNQMSYASIIDKGFTPMPPNSLQDHMAGH
jgi:gluconate 2-dehydrogenase gamma chain